jgi:hypothetical protein
MASASVRDAGTSVFDQRHNEARYRCNKIIDNRLCSSERWAEIEIHGRFQDCNMTSQYGAAEGVDLAERSSIDWSGRSL